MDLFVEERTQFAFVLNMQFGCLGDSSQKLQTQLGLRYWPGKHPQKWFKTDQTDCTVI